MDGRDEKKHWKIKVERDLKVNGTIVQEKTAFRADSVFSFKMVVVQRDYILQALI